MDNDPARISVLVDDYCRSWSESDPTERLRQLSSVLIPECRYCDPTVSLSGVAALSDHIGHALARRPGFVRRTSSVLLHHDVAYFKWRRVLHEGPELPEGVDVIEITSAGQISRVIGFFGPLPATQEV